MVPLLLLTANFALAAKDGSLKDLDKHAGFRDLAFGTDCTAVDGFRGNKLALKAAGAKRTDKEPFVGLLHYRMPDEELMIGGTPLMDVAYTCYSDRLMSVRLLAWGTHSADELLFTFQTAFGEPPTADPDMGVWRWDGKKVVLALQHDRGTDSVTAVFTSIPAVDQKRLDDETRRRSAVEDL